MTYLVGAGAGGGVDSVNGDTGPAVTLVATEVGAMPGEIYANEAALIAATPAEGDGTIAYASTEDTYWKRTEGKWIREGSSANFENTTNYSGLAFANGDTTAAPFSDNGLSVLNGAINIFTDIGANGNKGISIGSNLLNNVTVSTAPWYINLTGVAIAGAAGQLTCTTVAPYSLVVGQLLVISGTLGGTGSITGYADPTTYRVSATNGTTTFTLTTPAGGAIVTAVGTPTGLTYELQPGVIDIGGGPENVDMAKLTFVAGGSFTSDFSDMFGNNEKMSIWNVWDSIFTSPTKTNTVYNMSLVYLSESTTAADIGWYVIYDYINSAATNDGLLVIPWVQVLDILSAGSPTPLIMTSNVGCKSSVFTQGTQLSSDFPGYFTVPQEYYNTSGAAIIGSNHGQSLSCIIGQNEADGVASFVVAGINLGALSGTVAYFVNDTTATVTSAVIYGQNANVGSAAPVLILSQLGTGPHIKVNALASTPSMAAGETSYVAGTVNRWVYRDNVGDKNIASETWVKTPRVQPVVSAANITPVAATDDAINITAQAAAINFVNPTGTPVNFQKLIIRLNDNGGATPRAITFDTAYIPMGVALPTTTLGTGKIMRMEFEYDSTTSKFGLIQINQEA